MNNYDNNYEMNYEMDYGYPKATSMNPNMYGMPKKMPMPIPKEPKTTNPKLQKEYAHLKPYLLNEVEPVVMHGMREMQKFGPKHAMSEVAMITYLMGKGYHMNLAVEIVESFEKNEHFYK